MSASDHRKRLAFEVLVVDHHVRVRAFVRSLGVDPDWVDDLAQEAFVTAYEKWDDFDQTRDFGKWIRGIAANLVKNELRKDGRRKRILNTDLAEVLLRQQRDKQQPPTPVTVDAVKECLSRLAPKNQSIVEGRYRDGMTSTELAQHLGLTAANIRQSLVRIRKQIRECVESRVLREASHG